MQTISRTTPPPAVDVLALHLRCSAGKLASASSTSIVRRHAAPSVLSSAVARPTCRQAVRALAQSIDRELAARFSAAVAADSCRYSAPVRIGLGAAAAAVQAVALAMQTATLAQAASLIAVLLVADVIASSVGDGRRRREGVT